MRAAVSGRQPGETLVSDHGFRREAAATAYLQEAAGGRTFPEDTLTA